MLRLTLEPTHKSITPHKQSADKSGLNSAEPLPMLAFSEPHNVTANDSDRSMCPKFNASFSSNQIFQKHCYDIGFAPDTPIGLVAPVIQACDHKGLIEITAEVQEFAEKARKTSCHSKKCPEVASRFRLWAASPAADLH